MRLVVQTLSCICLFTTQGPQHARLPCPSLSPRVCLNSCPLSWGCHPAFKIYCPGCGWVLWSVYRGFAYLVGTRVSRVQGRSRAGWSRASLVLGSTTTTTTHGVLGRFAGPSVLDEVSPYLARLRWGAFSDFPKHQRRTNRWGLSHYLPAAHLNGAASRPR